MNTIDMNQDDALGLGADYSDEQGVFGTGHTAAPQPEQTGGNAAKWLLIGFGILFAGCIGWVALKFINRGGDEAQAAAGLPIAATYDESVPMTGAPVHAGAEPMSPGVGVLPQAGAPLAPQSVSVVEPSLDTPVAPGQVAVEAHLAVEQQLVASASPQEAAAEGDVPAEMMPENDQQLEDRIDEVARKLDEIVRRLDAVEKRTERVARSQRRPQRTQSSAPKVSERTDSAPPVAHGAVLKAVLDGRAWLQLKSGETVTVSPGVEVSGLGKVRAIDAERGEVHFVSGLILR